MDKELNILEEKHKCDICGRNFKGQSYPVYDENYNKQEDLIQCEKCWKPKK